MLKKLLVVPVFAFGFISITSFIGGNFFAFFSWLFLGIIYLISTYPLATQMDEKTTPVFQIFVSLLFLVLFIWSIATLDFSKAGFPAIQAVPYGLVIGLLSVATIMILKGNGKKK